MDHTQAAPSASSSIPSAPPVARPAPLNLTHNGEPVRKDYRVPFGGMVRLAFGEMRDFMVACRGDISLGGMYLPITESIPVGTTLDLELMLGDDLTLVRGRGEVVWVGQGASSKNLRPGVGIRFLHPDPLGRDLIFRTVDRYIQMGGLPFDLDGIEYRSAAATKNRWRPPARESQPSKHPIAKWCSGLLGR